MYTLENTVNEIMADRLKAGTYDVLSLWTEHGEGVMPEPDNSKKSVFLMTEKFTEKKPAVLICPGGGYTDVALASEGFKTYAELKKQGYHPFILNYRVFPNHYPEPQKDVALAFKYLRANAEDLLISPDDILLMGYSAGGHLCASETAYAAEYEKMVMEDLERDLPELAVKYRDIPVRADKLCLCYPVISFSEEVHEGSVQSLTGGDESLRDKLSIERHVPADFPKTFLWTCLDDTTVPPSNTIRMAEALKKQKIDHMLKLYPTGEHACSTGAGTSAEGWIEEMKKFMLSF